MGKFRKAIASISMVAILSSLVITTTAFASYDDVAADHWAYDAVTAFEADGTLTPAETLRVNDPVNRAEMMKIVVGAGGLVGDVLCSTTFEDVASGTWYDEVCGVAYQNEVFRGNDSGMMMPGANINRADLAVVLHRVVGGGTEYQGSNHFNDINSGVYYDHAAGWARCYGVVGGYADGSFGPGREATRGEALVMVYRAFGDMELDAACTETPVDDTPVDDTVNTGDMAVSLSDESPAGATLPKNSTSVPVASWDFSPTGTSDSTLQSLEIHRFGVSTLPSDHQVYLYDGNDRLTSGKSVNSTTNVVTFNNLNIDIDNSETKTLTLRLDVGAVALTGELGFEIASASAVGSDGEVSGSFPLAGALFGTSTTAAGSVTIQKNGTITNPKVGEDDVTVAKFKIAAATEEASVEQLNLYVTGTIANDAIENFELYVSGEDNAIATVEGLNSKDLATLVFDEPYVITKGDTKSFTLKADFNTGRTSDTIQIYIDESTDVVAIGGTYGYGMQVIMTGASGYDAVTTACTSSAGTCSYSSLEGGDITITSSGPTAGDIAIGGDDVNLMNFSVTAVSDITVKNFPFAMTASEAEATEGLMNSTTSNFTDIKIVNADTGETLMGPIDADVLTTGLNNATAQSEALDTDAAIAYYLFTDEFDMDAGEELNLSILTDVANTTTLDAMTVYATIDLGNTSNTYPEIKDVNNKTVTNTSSLVPTSDIVGKTMTVGAPSLTTALASVPVAGGNTHVKGEKGVDVLGVSVRCGSASDCKVTDISVVANIDDDSDGYFEAGVQAVANDASSHATQFNTYMGSVWLVDSADNVVAPAKAVTSGGTVTFDNLSWDLDAGESTVVYVVGDISTNAFANSDAERLAFSVADAAMSFEDEDGNSRTSSGAVNALSSNAPTTWVTTSAGGSLTVAVSPSTPNEDIVVSGAADQEISKFKFTTTDEAFLVTKLSINARQSALLTANLGDYDNNVSTLKISYVNSAGATETKSGSLSKGTAQFSGLDMLVGKDDQASLTVYATVSSIDNSQATAGEFIDLNLAFNNFEAVAQSTGDTYKADKIDATVAAGSDLDFGTITWANSTDDIDTGDLVGTTTLGGSASFTIDDGAGAVDQDYPVGTLLCIDDGAGGSCSGEDVYVVTSTSAGATELTVTATLVDNAGDGTYADADNVFYALPGSGYLTTAKRMVVYNTVPTLSLDASSPSGARTVNSQDQIMKFNVVPSSSDDVIIRQGLALDDDSATDVLEGAGNTPEDDVIAATTTSGDFIDGTSGISWLDDTAPADNDCFEFTQASATAGDLSSYGFISFWIKTDQTDIPLDELELVTHTAATCAGATLVTYLNDTTNGTVDNTTNLVWTDGTEVTSDSELIGSVADTWKLVTIALPAAAVDTETYIGFRVSDQVDAFDANETIFIDGVVLHNEMLVIDVAANAVLDKTPTTIIDCSLKDGNTTVATTAMGVSTTSQARMLIVPENNISGTDYSDIEIPRTTGKTFTLECDTSDLVAQTVNDDLLTPSIDFGSSNGGTVTRGDFWWSADEATRTLVYWLGDAGTKLSGSTLRY